MTKEISKKLGVYIIAIIIIIPIGLQDIKGVGEEKQYEITIKTTKDESKAPSIFSITRELETEGQVFKKDTNEEKVLKQGVYKKIIKKIKIITDKWTQQR